jgi:hypothetical protein
MTPHKTWYKLPGCDEYRIFSLILHRNVFRIYCNGLQSTTRDAILKSRDVVFQMNLIYRSDNLSGNDIKRVCLFYVTNVHYSHIFSVLQDICTHFYCSVCVHSTGTHNNIRKSERSLFFHTHTHPPTHTHTHSEFSTTLLSKNCA